MNVCLNVCLISVVLQRLHLMVKGTGTNRLVLPPNFNLFVVTITSSIKSSAYVINLQQLFTKIRTSFFCQIQFFGVLAVVAALDVMHRDTRLGSIE
jgi:hypothetical protein